MSLTAILRQKNIQGVEEYKPQQDSHTSAKPKLMAKNEYRAGDWICNVCNNHNYSFRSVCNRCNSQTKENNLRQMLMNCNNENVEPNALYVTELVHKPELSITQVPQVGAGVAPKRLPFAELGTSNKLGGKSTEGLFSCFDKLIVDSDEDESGYEVSINSRFFDFMNNEC